MLFVMDFFSLLLLMIAPPSGYEMIYNHVIVTYTDILYTLLCYIS